MASVTEDLKFYFILINLNRCMCLVPAVLDSTDSKTNFFLLLQDKHLLYEKAI